MHPTELQDAQKLGQGVQVTDVAVPLLKYSKVLQPIHFPSVVVDPSAHVAQPTKALEHKVQIPLIRTQSVSHLVHF